ncbi:MAG: hypothetical protein RLZZ373_3686 [Pseudomonadota bacterium]|jgi:hypothetical protein
MNNGDDIHNLLKTLGHDAGIYQDLAKYNASRAAVRRAAMGRPAEAATAAAGLPAAPPVPASASEVPRVLRVGQDAQAGSPSLSAILNRLASPNDPAPAASAGQGAVAARAATGVAAVQPVRLDRLFGRLANRAPSPLNR